jgi:hypothetical protein
MSSLTMSAVPPVIFLGSALLLFGCSNILPRAEPAMRAPLRRFILQAVVSLAVLGAALFVVLTHGRDYGNKPWAYASMGMVVGYWMKAK